jgi:tRNA (guanine-N7-)-methyltransferase
MVICKSLTPCSPASPAEMDWASHYPAYAEPTQSLEEPTGPSAVVQKMKQDVEVADIGCGFGGLTVALAPKLPNTLILGRTRQAVTYVNHANM